MKRPVEVVIKGKRGTGMYVFGNVTKIVYDNGDLEYIAETTRGNGRPNVYGG